MRRLSVHPPILKAPPRTSPVSQAIELSGLVGKELLAAQRALAAVDFVHDDGDLPTIPILKNSRLRNTLGQYVRHGFSARAIEIKPSQDGMAFTLLEEIGHFLDHQAFGTHGFDFASEDSERFEAWRAAVYSSQPVQDLMRGVKTARGPLRSQFIEGARLREIWGRSYSQYMAIKSGDPVLLKQFQEDQSSLFGGLFYWTQRQFLPIMQEVEKLLLSL